MTILDLLYKAKKLSVHLHFWHADNLVISVWIEMELARNESCILVDDRVYFYKGTEPIVH